MMAGMSIARELTGQYLQRAGQSGRQLGGAVYQFQLEHLRETLVRLEIVLQDEGADPDLIERVIRAMLYGSPSPAVGDLVTAMADETTEMLAEHGVPVMSVPPAAGPATVSSGDRPAHPR